jgi:hypothetical protein
MKKIKTVGFQIAMRFDPAFIRVPFFLPFGYGFNTHFTQLSFSRRNVS